MEKRVWFGRNRKCGACRDADGVGLVGYKDADGVCPSKCYRILAQPRGKGIGGGCVVGGSGCVWWEGEQMLSLLHLADGALGF